MLAEPAVYEHMNGWVAEAARPSGTNDFQPGLLRQMIAEPAFYNNEWLLNRPDLLVTK